MKKFIIIIGVIVVLGLIGGGLYASYTYYSMKKIVERDVIYEGIYIDGIHIGGMTTETAITVTEEQFNKNMNKEINILLDDTIIYTLPYTYFEFEGDYEKIIEHCYNMGKNGSIFERYKFISKLKEEEISFASSVWYNKDKVNEFISSIKNDFSILPKNAIIQRINNEFVIENEVIGQSLKINESIQNLNHSLEKNLGEANLELVRTIPEFTQDFYDDIKEQVGSYYTEFGNSNPARNENLRVASNLLNGRLLLPEEVFSTYDAISPVSADNGYQAAPVIVNNKLVPGIGGGICQIATTLYNAVLFAELEIVERKNHSMPVGYIPKARDATLAGGYIDFRFKNNTKYPIWIESYIKDNKLYMNLYSKEVRPENRSIGFESFIVNTINPPESIIKVDPNLASGEQIVDVKALTGYNVKLYKKIYVADELVERIEINTSYYRPRAAEIRIGE